MGMFHVYVEAPDPSPAAVTRLAVTIGKKYGVPVADLESRLAAGRFRVKANVDRATADAYARALRESGAIVKIEPAVPTQPVPIVAPSAAPIETMGDDISGSVDVDMKSGPVNARAPMQSIPRPTNATGAPQVATPLDRSRSGAISLPPNNASSTARKSAPSLPPSNTRSGATSLPPANVSTKSGPIVTSGLAAAFTESAQPTDLGALSTDSLKLASLDGKDTGSQTAIPETFAPPVDLAPPPAEPVTPAPAKKPKDVPVDLFAPPEAAEDAAFKVDLAPDEVEHRARKMSTPPAGVPIAQPAIGSAPVSSPVLTKVKKPATPAAGIPVTVADSAQETPRWRFAAGVFLAIILGFLPAHLIASAREGAAYKKVDDAVIAQQDQTDTPEGYEQLDGFRAAQLEHKQSAHRSIAMQSMLIWAVLGAGIAYVWFRRVPWDKVMRRGAA